MFSDQDNVRGTFEEELYNVSATLNRFSFKRFLRVMPRIRKYILQ
jgi:hypothetical protein